MAIKQRVIVAAGHGGGDPGAVGQGTTEEREAISITNFLVEKLQRDSRIQVDLIPHSFGLEDAIDWVNSHTSVLEDAISIEIHKNVGGGSGSEVWAPSYADDTSKDMAGKIAAKMAAVTGLPNRGVKEAQNNRWGRLGWTDDTKTYAVLIEAGFIDIDAVGDRANERFAEGIYQGLLSVFNLPAKDPAPAPAPAPAPVAERKIDKYANVAQYVIKPGLLDDKAVLWNTTFNSWNDAKGVTSIARLKADGTPAIIDIAGEIKHPLGATYLVTKSSVDRNVPNGFNRNDLIPYVPPTPDEQPQKPSEGSVDTPKPTSPETSTPSTPHEEPASRDNEQDAKIKALEAALGGFFTLILSLAQNLIDGIKNLKK